MNALVTISPPAAAEPAAPPEVIIERRSDWRLLDGHELWRFRELLFFLAWRDVKVRYKQTVLGAAWAVLQPLATMAAFAVFLGPLVQAPGDGLPYALFAFAGLIPWTFLANAIGTGGQSLITNQKLVTKVHFPRLMIPMSAVGAGLVDFAVAFVLLAGMMAVFGTAPGWSVLLMPFLLVAIVLLATGVGILLSALTVAYRDFRYAVPFFVQFWMFATPGIYVPTTPGGSLWRYLLPLNPAQGLIVNFRAALLGRELDFYALAVSSVVTVALFLVGCLYFRRVEKSFADVI